MTFSFICSLPADEARKEIKAAHPKEQIPPPLREYVLWAINGLKLKHGPDVEVMVYITGHLCDDGRTHEVSTANVRVSPAKAMPRQYLRNDNDPMEQKEGAN